MTPATLAQARQAKPKLVELLDGVTELSGVGIAVLDGGFGLKVNLMKAVPDCEIPGEVDGVPVITQIAGVIELL